VFTRSLTVDSQNCHCSQFVEKVARLCYGESDVVMHKVAEELLSLTTREKNEEKET